MLDPNVSLPMFVTYRTNRLPTQHPQSLALKALQFDIEEGHDFTAGGTATLAYIDRLLAAIDPKSRTVIEPRVFGGLTGADRYSAFARRWLQKQLAPGVAL